MTTNIATTPDQSARLLQCGVSADTADMMWSRLDESRDHNLYAVPWSTPRVPNRKISDNNFPAWSLSVLLGLLPKKVLDEERNSFYLSLAQEFPTDDDYAAAYKPCWRDDSDLVRRSALCPIEACVELIEWLTANNYQLNRKANSVSNKNRENER